LTPKAFADYLPVYNENGSGCNVDAVYKQLDIVFKTGDAYHYNLQEHLGNVRATIEKVGTQAEVLQKDGYSRFAYSIRCS